MISLQYEAAKADISPFISSFYHFEYEGQPTVDLERADRPQMRFYLEGRGETRFGNGTRLPTFPVTIFGPTTTPIATSIPSHAIVFGWGITPIGWDALMGPRAAEFVDLCVDARDILGESIMNLRESLKQAESVEERFKIAQAAAGEIHYNCRQVAFDFTAKVDEWLNSCADPHVETLSEMTGLSCRQLARTTRHYYGMPPKKLARKYRALRVANLIANGIPHDDSDLNLIFYDQSHMIREVKRFTGLTPKQLRSGQSILTNATMKGRHKLAGQVASLISES